MSTSPDTRSRADDHLVAVISRWLARHVSDGDLLAALESVDGDELDAGQRAAVAELVGELRAGRGRGELEMVARETLEALALGA